MILIRWFYALQLEIPHCIKKFPLLQKNYKKEYENTKSNVVSMKETNEMIRAKELRPVQMQKLYTDDSKRMLQNVNIGSGICFFQNRNVGCRYSISYLC